MDVNQIGDPEKLGAFMASRSRPECVEIAQRSAMRIAPLWIGEVKFKSPTRQSEDLVFLRSLLIAGVAASLPSDKIAKASITAAQIIVFTDSTPSTSSAAAQLARDAVTLVTETSFATSATRIADQAPYFVINAVFAAGREIAERGVGSNPTLRSLTAPGFSELAEQQVAEAVVHDRRGSLGRRELAHYQNYAWASMRKDLVAVDGGKNSLTLPLWNGIKSTYAPDWTRARNILIARGPDWDFWVRWYDAALRGEPMNWKMQEEIALLPSEVWEGDVTGLAAAIAVIEHKYRLLEQIVDLKAKLLEAKAQDQIFDPALAQRWHNNPPELINTVGEVRDQFTLVLQAIDSAEDELNLSSPDPSVLQRIGTFLLSAGKAMLVYCASLWDVVLKEAAAVLGTTGTKVAIYGIAAKYFELGEPIQSLGKSMAEFAIKLLSGG